MVYALRPKLFVTERLPARVETTGELTAGMTVADFRPNRQVPADITVCTKANGKAKIPRLVRERPPVGVTSGWDPYS